MERKKQIYATGRKHTHSMVHAKGAACWTKVHVAINFCRAQDVMLIVTLPMRHLFLYHCFHTKPFSSRKTFPPDCSTACVQNPFA